MISTPYEEWQKKSVNRIPFINHALLISVIVVLAAALLWANWAVLDEVTRGEGRVIPSSQIQIIQNLEGGIVEDILVQEGAVVEHGEVLIRLWTTTREYKTPQ